MISRCTLQDNVTRSWFTLLLLLLELRPCHPLSGFQVKMSTVFIHITQHSELYLKKFQSWCILMHDYVMDMIWILKVSQKKIGLAITQYMLKLMQQDDNALNNMWHSVCCTCLLSFLSYCLLDVLSLYLTCYIFNKDVCLFFLSRSLLETSRMWFLDNCIQFNRTY